MQIPAKQAAGRAALELMDEHLSAREWFAGDKLSLADIALFAYTHVAEDADFALADYPGVVAWIERIRAVPNYISLDA
jgi:glutathione S-transferase